MKSGHRAHHNTQYTRKWREEKKKKFVQCQAAYAALANEAESCTDVDKKAHYAWDAFNIFA